MTPFDTAHSFDYSATLLRAVFNSGSQSVVLIDLEGRIQAFNKMAQAGFKKALNLELEIGKPFSQYIRLEDKPLFRKNFEPALLGEVVKAERVFKTLDGQDMWAEYSYNPVFNEEGKISGVCFVSNSIDDRKKTEEALRQSEEKFRKFFEEAPMAMAMVSDFKFVKVNRAFQAMLGYSEKEFIGKTLFEITHPEDLPQTKELASSVHDGKREKFQSEKRYLRKDGQSLWVNVSGTVIRDGAGSRLYSLIMVENITDRIKVQKALQKSEADLRGVFNSGSQMMTLLSPDGRILDCNHTAESYLEMMTGLKVEKGRVFTDYMNFNPEFKAEYVEFFARALRGEVMILERAIKSSEGKTYWLEFSYNPVYDASGLISGVCMTGIGIDERKKAEEALRKSEADLRAVFNSGSQMMILLSPEGNILDCNKTAEGFIQQMTGTLVEKGKAFIDYMSFNAGFKVEFKKNVERALKGEVVILERAVKSLAGVQYWLEFSHNPVYDASGMVTGICMTAILIDERKKAVEALRRSEADLKAVFNSGSHVMVLIGRDGRIHGFNKSAAVMAPRVLGRRLEMNMLFADTLPAGASLELFHKSFAEAMEGRETKGERAIRAADGRERWVEVNYQPVVNDAGEVDGVCFSLVFIDERKKAEKELRESQERFKRLAEVTQEGVLLHENPTVVDVNPALADMLGFTQEELIGKSGFDLLAPESHQEAKRHMRTGSYAPYEAMALRKDGSLLPVELRGRNFIFKDKELRVMSVRDLTWRKEAEKILTESEERYRKLVEFSPEAVVVHSEGKMLYVNSSGLKMFGVNQPEKIIGKMVLDFVHPDYRELSLTRVQKIAETGDQTEWTEQKLLRADGQVMDAETKGTPFVYQGHPAVLTIVRDVTDRKKTQGMLLRYERLAAVGNVIAAIAHEIRNPLAVVSGMSQILKAKLESRSEFSQELATILAQTDRLRLFMNDILDYSRETEIKKEKVQLQALLERSLVTAQTQFGPGHVGFDMEQDLERTIPDLWADGERLEQVLSNLILNAFQSMKDKGTLTLSARVQEGWIILGVKDTGPGISEADLPHLFEPFFTTKKNGSGLGLSISQKIAEAHRGKIEVRRIQPQGTLFTLQLPLQKI